MSNIESSTPERHRPKPVSKKNEQKLSRAQRLKGAKKQISIRPTFVAFQLPEDNYAARKTPRAGWKKCKHPTWRQPAPPSPSPLHRKERMKASGGRLKSVLIMNESSAVGVSGIVGLGRGRRERFFFPFSKKSPAVPPAAAAAPPRLASKLLFKIPTLF